MSRPVFISGGSVDLVPLRKEDARENHRWVNDMEIIVSTGPEPLPEGIEQQGSWFADVYKQKRSMLLGICLKGADTLIGIGGLSHIEWVNRRGELTISIGDKEHQGKGYGTEATRLILDHAFRKLNLHSVMLRVIDYNERAKRCYAKCGFKLIGRRRQAKIIDGQFFDVLYMDTLAEEFLAGHPGSTA